LFGLGVVGFMEYSIGRVVLEELGTIWGYFALPLFGGLVGLFSWAVWWNVYGNYKETAPWMFDDYNKSKKGKPDSWK